jgi:hypothetical protein
VRARSIHHDVDGNSPRFLAAVACFDGQLGLGRVEGGEAATTDRSYFAGGANVRISLRAGRTAAPPPPRPDSRSRCAGGLNKVYVPAGDYRERGFFFTFRGAWLCSPSCLSVLSILPPLQTRVFKKERKRSGHGMQAQHHGSLQRDRSNHSDTALVSFTPPWISQATGTHCSSLAL